MVLLFSTFFGGVVVVLPSLRSFWVVLFSLPSLVVVRFVRLPCGWWSFSFERQLNGANELNQVAVKQSEANESKVVLFRMVVVFPSSSVWVAVFSLFLSPFGSLVFFLLLLFGWRCFPPFSAFRVVLGVVSPLTFC